MVEAKHLKIGDSLLTFSGKKCKLDSIYTYSTKEPVAVFNFEVPGNHNYYVSSTKVLVHNCGKDKLLKALKFMGDEANIHFEKHASEIMEVLNKNSYNLKEYIDDANWIVNNGYYLESKNCYFYYFNNSSKNGKSLVGFVGLTRDGKNITAFHLKSAKELGL